MLIKFVRDARDEGYQFDEGREEGRPVPRGSVSFIQLRQTEVGLKRKSLVRVGGFLEKVYAVETWLGGRGNK